MFDLVKTAHAGNLEIFAFSKYKNLGDFISSFINPIITIFGFIILMFIIFAGFKYLTAGGDKEAVAQAQTMIRNSVVGFILFLLLFLLIIFLQNWFDLGNTIVKG